MEIAVSAIHRAEIIPPNRSRTRRIQFSPITRTSFWLSPSSSALNERAVWRDAPAVGAPFLSAVLAGGFAVTVCPLPVLVNSAVSSTPTPFLHAQFALRFGNSQRAIFLDLIVSCVGIVSDSISVAERGNAVSFYGYSRQVSGITFEFTDRQHRSFICRHNAGNPIDCQHQRRAGRRVGIARREL
jgi:hypothetical protein